MKISGKTVFSPTCVCRLAFHRNPLSNTLMRIFNSSSPLAWGELDLPLLGITTDWFGKPLLPPLTFSLASDPGHLWFVATRQAPASFLPGATPGSFTPGLWESDVAELFIASHDGAAYLEFNLAPNGAWWASKFSSPRQTSEDQPDFQNHIRTYHDATDPDSWVAAISIPLGFLRDHISFGVGSPANAAFILNTPEQTFHSAAKLPGEQPDFHQPSKFPKAIPLKLPPH